MQENVIGDVKEYAFAIYLKGSKIIGYSCLSVGGMASTLLDSRLIFAEAFLISASSFIIVHNHPSGADTPSEADKSITKKLYQSGVILGITLLDSIIYSGGDSFYSFADNGAL